MTNLLTHRSNETLRLLPPVLSGSQRIVQKGTGSVTFGSQ